MIPPSALRDIIRQRAITRQVLERQQLHLTPDEDDFHETVRAKLDGISSTNQFWNFSRCGNEEIFRTCKRCHTVKKFTYRCNIKWCPRCQWRVTDTRRKVIQLWTQKITQPKHLVLTQKNFPILTRRAIRRMTHSLARMRRKKSFAAVRGGCTSVEITNEGSGWHLHSHWLLDTDWLPMPRISTDWASLVGQQFAIVKVKDCRDRDYLQEITKYVVSGSELAKWPAPQINEFVQAVKGLRFFFAFGTLHALGPAIRKQLAWTKPPPPICECGCSDFVYEDETNAVLHELAAASRARR